MVAFALFASGWPVVKRAGEWPLRANRIAFTKRKAKTISSVLEMYENVTLLVGALFLTLSCCLRPRLCRTPPSSPSCCKTSWSAPRCNDIATHDRFWADDLIYTSSSGSRMGKADILRSVRQEGPHQSRATKPRFLAPKTFVSSNTATTAIIAFRLVGTTKKEVTKRARQLSQHWHLSEARREMGRPVSWQATKLSAEDKPKK